MRRIPQLFVYSTHWCIIRTPSIMALSITQRIKPFLLLDYSTNSDFYKQTDNGDTPATLYIWFNIILHIFVVSFRFNIIWLSFPWLIRILNFGFQILNPSGHSYIYTLKNKTRCNAVMHCLYDYYRRNNKVF
jgi:hypothetical protein